MPVQPAPQLAGATPRIETANKHRPASRSASPASSIGGRQIPTHVLRTLNSSRRALALQTNTRNEDETATTMIASNMSNYIQALALDLVRSQQDRQEERRQREQEREDLRLQRDAERKEREEERKEQRRREEEEQRRRDEEQRRRDEERRHREEIREAERREDREARNRFMEMVMMGVAGYFAGMEKKRKRSDEENKDDSA